MTSRAIYVVCRIVRRPDGDTTELVTAYYDQDTAYAHAEEADGVFRHSSRVYHSVRAVELRED